MASAQIAVVKGLRSPLKGSSHPSMHFTSERQETVVGVDTVDDFHQSTRSPSMDRTRPQSALSATGITIRLKTQVATLELELEKRSCLIEEQRQIIDELRQNQVFLLNLKTLSSVTSSPGLLCRPL